MSTNENGDTVVIYPDDSTSTYPPCEQPFLISEGHETRLGDFPSNGNQTWAIYTQLHNATITEFSADVVIPKIQQFPYDNNAMLSFVVSVQNVKDNTFRNASDFCGLQSALYYVGSLDTQGNWSLSSTYYINGHFFVVNTDMDVDPGDLARVLFKKINDTTWMIDSFEGYYIVASSPLLSMLPYATIGYAVYDIPSCQFFPSNPVSFTNMKWAASPWELVNPPNACNAKAISHSPEELAFLFQ